ncbi:hypothetical protein IFR05_013173 [Cadophora sp. M221]|nr:hypothetical protein IFR05_013173 [Cadophora sp. M221]
MSFGPLDGLVSRHVEVLVTEAGDVLAVRAAGFVVIIKTATKERKKFLKQEYDSHCKLAISSSPFIRKMCDIVGDVEDFDDRSQNHAPCIKPENILVSGLENLRPTAKIGDLGLTATDRFNKYQVQPFAMRAPEIWRGYGCTHRSDVWSLAAAVLAWAKPGTLGVAGMKGGLWPQLWCMVKLMGVFPGWTALPATSCMNETAAIAAKDILGAKDPDRPDEQYVKVRSLDEELQSVNISAETANMLRYLLITDPGNRPEAADALASPEFQALVLKVTGYVQSSPRAAM